MFLIATADQRFWKFDGKGLFLGEWCRLYSSRLTWQRLDYQVLPYHWDDRQKLRRDYLYLNNLYERYLEDLSGKLNQIHGVQYSSRYWRIVVGPWLYFFITIVFDRYESVLQAESTGTVTDTIVGEYQQADWVLRDNLDLARCFESDEYNQYFLSRIIRFRQRFPFTSIVVGAEIRTILESKENHRRNGYSLKGVVRQLLFQVSQWVPSSLNQVVLVSSSLHLRDLARLQLAMRQMPYLYSPLLRTRETRVNFNLRRSLILNAPESEFEELLQQMIQENLPLVYLEGYKDMKERALDAFPKHPRVIFTSIAFEVDEGFKFWSAHHVERGCRFVGTQHGFNYGFNLWNQEEAHQLKIYDRFYTWGWESDGWKNTKPLPAAKFNKVQRAVTPKQGGRILFTTFVWPRYAYKMYSVPVSASQGAAHMKYEFRFARALPEEVARHLLIRLFPNDRHWSQRERWTEEFPELEVYHGSSISFYDHMNESCLLVTLVNGTTYLEALRGNFPTIALWNPELFEVRSSAKLHLGELQQAEMLFVTPEAAAAKVTEVYRDPLSWWQSKKVQDVRRRFCDEFARRSKNWLGEWTKELLDLCNDSELVSRGH